MTVLVLLPGASSLVSCELPDFAALSSGETVDFYSWEDYLQSDYDGFCDWVDAYVADLFDSETQWDFAD